MQRKSLIFQKSVFCIGILMGLICLMGCSGASESKSDSEPLRIGLMITPQGLNDKGFNDYAYDGLQSAEKKFNVEGTIIEPSTMKAPEDTLRFFAGQEFDAIIVVGVAFSDVIRKVASEHPELNFYVIDSDIDEGNIRGITFRENEGAYLCGHLAARMSKTGKVAFVGGMQIPVIDKFSQGYIAGAKAANPEVEVFTEYVSDDFDGFNSADKAAQIALGLYRQGCDVIFSAAGASSLGVISAAVQTDNYVIGVDMNQDSLAPGLVLTSMLKRVDLVVEDIVSNIVKGHPADKIRRTYGMSDGAIGLSDFQLSFKVVGDEIIAELEELRKQIIEGKINTRAR